MPSSIFASGKISIPPMIRPQFPTIDAADPAFDRVLVVHLDGGPDGLAGKLADARFNVSEPAHAVLEDVHGVRHDCGVIADAGHHHEHVLVLRPVEPAPDHVHCAFRAVQHVIGGGDGVRDVDAQVARQQVAGSERHEPQRRVGAGEHLSNAAHGSVAAGGNTTSTPASSASRVCPTPGSSTVVSSHSGSAQPCVSHSRISEARRSAPTAFAGLMTTAARCGGEALFAVMMSFCW